MKILEKKLALQIYIPVSLVFTLVASGLRFTAGRGYVCLFFVVGKLLLTQVTQVAYLIAARKYLLRVSTLGWFPVASQQLVNGTQIANEDFWKSEVFVVLFKYLQDNIPRFKCGFEFKWNKKYNSCFFFILLQRKNYW